MKTYYKQTDENGKIVALLTYDIEPNFTDPLIVEITAEEYEAIREEWAEIANADIIILDDDDDEQAIKKKASDLGVDVGNFAEHQLNPLLIDNNHSNDIIS